MIAMFLLAAFDRRRDSEFCDWHTAGIVGSINPGRLRL